MTDYRTNKSTPPEDAFTVQAIRYMGSGATIDAAHWAACDQDGANGCLVAGMGFLDRQRAFPINHGAGLQVSTGDWIVRYWDSSVEIMGDEEFNASFCKFGAGL